MKTHRQPPPGLLAVTPPARTPHLALAALFCAVALASCTKQSGPATPPAPEVATITVTPQSLVLTTELPGRTAPYRIAEIRPQVSGLIQKRLFTEGAEVVAGQELYQIDPAQLRAAYDSALASLGRAEASLPAARARAERFAGLVADKAVSQQGNDDAASALRQVEADVQYWKAMAEAARLNLAYTGITSPIPGRIGKSTVTDGAIVTAYQPVALATVQQLDPIYVDVPQSTAELLRLERRLAGGHLARDGSAQNVVRLFEEDGAPYPHEGTLQFRDVSVDQSTGAVTLRMVFPNPDGILLPGMFVRTVIKEGVRKDAILVPQQSVTRDPRGNPQVMIVDDHGTAQRRAVEIDRAIGNQWLVTAGLTAGDRLIVEGLQRVRPGTPVNAVPANGAGRSAPPAALPVPQPN